MDNKQQKVTLQILTATVGFVDRQKWRSGMVFSALWAIDRLSS
jgi:hypothetical protein